MTDDLRLRQYLDAARFKVIKEPARGLFKGIPNLGRRLFAVQRYVCALRDPAQGQTWVDGRWAMNGEQFAHWRASPAGALRSHELRTIIARFGAANPGHRLVAGSQFRPLDEQIYIWNHNPLVGTHAATLLARARRELRDETRYPDLGPYLHEASGLLSHLAGPASSVPGTLPGMIGGTLRGMPGMTEAASAADDLRHRRNAAIEQFARWLAIRRYWKPKLMVATPGLSDHGVGQAIDFQIHRNGVGPIFAAGSPESWRSSGWATRLAAAVEPSRYFTGPLRAPDEPWHWTFDATP